MTLQTGEGLEVLALLDCRLPIADCRLEDCRVPIADCWDCGIADWRIADCWIADCWIADCWIADVGLDVSRILWKKENGVTSC
jgi:hypothetical protein